LLTPGEQRWDYLYVQDAAEAISQAGIAARAEGIYNIGSGMAHTIRGVVERIRDQIDPTLPLGLGEIPYRQDQVMHLQADISRFQGDTRWAPTTGIDDGIRHTVDWYRTAKPEDKGKA
jgi:nucleoside-diphosphate-sugar epimerase